MKTSHKVFFLHTFEKLIMFWPKMSHLVMKSALIVPRDKPLLTIGYTYISKKVLRIISTEGAGSTEPDVPYLSRYPENYSNVSI